MSKEIIDALTSRRTIRKYDKNVKISKQEMEEILTIALDAPSSMNLQPWRFVIVETEAAKKIVEPFVKYNPIQHETSAATIVILGDLDNHKLSEDIFARFEGLSNDEQKQLTDKYFTRMEDAGRRRRRDIALFDTGLITMQLMLTARAFGYDTCPIGGFDKEGLAEALGYDENRYEPMLLLTIGKAVEEPRETARLAVETVAKWR